MVPFGQIAQFLKRKNKLNKMEKNYKRGCKNKRKA
jgi:hypothetical protein